MAMNIRAFWRFTRRLLSKIGDPDFGWMPRRVGIFLALYLLYPLVELVTWPCFLLDNLLYRRYRQVDVKSPVFIVGNFRSGTTFLHRLLAQDRKRFTTMKLWQILLAPSVLQRKLVKALLILDRWLGGLVDKRVASMEQQWQEQNTMHRTGLRAPEEDDYLLLHLWSALTIGLSSGLLEEAVPYTYFDTALPEAERDRIMAFYQRCVQRHLYTDGGDGTQYLAKNPALTPKLDSIYRWFPDARIICLVRNPLQMVPSFVDMMQRSWQVLGSPDESDALRDYIVDMARHWYHYPLERLAGVPSDQYMLVRYNDLVADPWQTVADIYDHFGFEISPAFAQVLRQEAERASHFRSRHTYSLEGTGLARARILAEYREVFERFGFQTDKPMQEEGLLAGTRRPRYRPPVPRRDRARPRSRPGLTTESSQGGA